MSGSNVQWHKSECEIPTQDGQYLTYVYFSDDNTYSMIVDTYTKREERSWGMENTDWFAHTIFWAELPEPPV